MFFLVLKDQCFARLSKEAKLLRSAIKFARRVTGIASFSGDTRNWLQLTVLADLQLLFETPVA